MSNGFQQPKFSKRVIGPSSSARKEGSAAQLETLGGEKKSLSSRLHDSAKDRYGSKDYAMLEEDEDPIRYERNSSSKSKMTEHGKVPSKLNTLDLLSSPANSLKGMKKVSKNALEGNDSSNGVSTHDTDNPLATPPTTQDSGRKRNFRVDRFTNKDEGATSRLSSTAHSDSNSDTLLGTQPRSQYRSMRVNIAQKALIGQGSYGKVYQAMNRETNRIIAVKEVVLDDYNKDNKGLMEGLRRELGLMRQLSHPNIVQFLGDEMDGSFLRIYMEYVAGGSISSLLKKFGPFQECQASAFARQILHGLDYLHSKNIIHRDLKGDNLLVDTSGELKLADFGTAKNVAGVQTSNGKVVGTANFVSPEIVNGNVCTTKADIWSLGCCVIEMLAGVPPLANLPNQYAIMMFIAQCKEENIFDTYVPKGNKWSTEALDFIRLCLNRNPKKRPTARELLQHAWIEEPSREENTFSPQRSVLSTTVMSLCAHDAEAAGASPPSRADSNDSFSPSSNRGKQKSQSREKKEKRRSKSKQNSPQPSPKGEHLIEGPSNEKLDLQEKGQKKSVGRGSSKQIYDLYSSSTMNSPQEGKINSGYFSSSFLPSIATGSHNDSVTNVGKRKEPSPSSAFNYGELNAS